MGGAVVVIQILITLRIVVNLFIILLIVVIWYPSADVSLSLRVTFGVIGFVTEQFRERQLDRHIEQALK